MSVTRFSLTVFARAAGTDFSAPQYYLLLQAYAHEKEERAPFCKVRPFSWGNEWERQVGFDL